MLLAVPSLTCQFVFLLFYKLFHFCVSIWHIKLGSNYSMYLSVFICFAEYAFVFHHFQLESIIFLQLYIQSSREDIFLIYLYSTYAYTFMRHFFLFMNIDFTCAILNFISMMHLLSWSAPPKYLKFFARSSKKLPS